METPPREKTNFFKSRLSTTFPGYLCRMDHEKQPPGRPWHRWNITPRENTQLFKSRLSTNFPRYLCSMVGPRAPITTVILCVFVVLYVCCFFTLNAGLLATGQYSEGPATGHLDTGFSWFPCAQKQMLRWFLRFQVATTCFSCSPTELNVVVTNFMFILHVK